MGLKDVMRNVPLGKKVVLLDHQRVAWVAP